MTPPPTNAVRVDLGMVGMLSDEDTTSRPTGFLSLPDELIVRIYASTLALDIRILPMENPFDKWKIAFVNRRIYEIAKPVFLSHVAVFDGSDPLPNVLSFLAGQAEPLRTTRSLYLEVDAILLALATALAPRLFPNLTSLTLAASHDDHSDDRYILSRRATDILPQLQQLQSLEIESYDSLADKEFDLTRLPSLQQLQLRRSTTNEVGIQLLRNVDVSALNELELYSRDHIPATLVLPWQRLSGLVLHFWDQFTCYRVLKSALERVSTGPLPLRFLNVHAPWQQVDLDRVTLELPHVIAFTDFLKAVFKRASISRLKLESLTAWPAEPAILRYEGLRKLELRWTTQDVPEGPAPGPPPPILPLPSLYHILSCFPMLTHFRLDIRFVHEYADGRWLHKHSDDDSPLADIFEPNLMSFVRYLRSTTIVHFTFCPSHIPGDPDDKVELRWTRASVEEDFVLSKWTCMH